MKSGRIKMRWIWMLGIFAFQFSHAQTVDTTLSGIVKTAEKEINGFIIDLPLNDLASYGFKSREEYKKIVFAEPIPVFTLRDSVVAFTETWRVPLTIDGEYRSLLTVIRENGTIKAVDFGAAGLARAWQLNKTTQTVGMLRVYELRKDYLIEGREKSNQRFIPLEFND